MPTGYTSIIEEGCSFRDYALRCARGMGACIMQKDDSFDDLPKLQEPSDYHIKGQKEANEKLAEIISLSEEQTEKRAETEYLFEIARIKGYIEQEKDKKKKYDIIRALVVTWMPPTTDHLELKRLMLNQIDLCLENLVEYYSKKLDDMKQLSSEKWRIENIKQLSMDIEYHIAERLKEKEHVDSRNKWIKELYDSLPTVDKSKE